MCESASCTRRKAEGLPGDSVHLVVQDPNPQELGAPHCHVFTGETFCGGYSYKRIFKVASEPRMHARLKSVTPFPAIRGSRKPRMHARLPQKLSSICQSWFGRSSGSL